MWELDHEAYWAPKSWCFWTVLLKTLKSPLDCKEIKPVHPKGDQSWTLTGRTDAEAEAPILWLPDAKSRLIRKDPDAGKNWEQEEKGQQRMRWWMTLSAQWTWVWANSGREWQGSLVCCSQWGHEDSAQLSNWTGTTTGHRCNSSSYSAQLGQLHSTTHYLILKINSYSIMKSWFKAVI